MDKIKVEKLKTALREIILLNNRISKSTIKEKQTLKTQIKYFTDNLITDFDLVSYDIAIKEESGKIKLFISDVERIIRKYEI